MDGVMKMAQTVRLDGDQVDKLVELVKEHKDKILGGDVTGFGQSVADEISDWDSILYALGEDDE
jgi:hypothetical protein